ncbi:MAG TPA: hypothetical protein VHA37_08695 [Candidatus Saccharimonadales bacterium]|nr:hypothetical protein [Candidatus Saccharimonadales bacterium]
MNQGNSLTAWSSGQGSTTAISTAFLAQLTGGAVVAENFAGTSGTWGPGDPQLPVSPPNTANGNYYSFQVSNLIAVDQPTLKSSLASTADSTQQRIAFVDTAGVVNVISGPLLNVGIGGMGSSNGNGFPVPTTSVITPTAQWTQEKVPSSSKAYAASGLSFLTEANAVLLPYLGADGKIHILRSAIGSHSWSEINSGGIPRNAGGGGGAVVGYDIVDANGTASPAIGYMAVGRNGNPELHEMIGTAVQGGWTWADRTIVSDPINAPALGTDLVHASHGGQVRKLYYADRINNLWEASLNGSSNSAMGSWSISNIWTNPDPHSTGPLKFAGVTDDHMNVYIFNVDGAGTLSVLTNVSGAWKNVALSGSRTAVFPNGPGANTEGLGVYFYNKWIGVQFIGAQTAMPQFVNWQVRFSAGAMPTARTGKYFHVPGP